MSRAEELGRRAEERGGMLESKAKKYAMADNYDLRKVAMSNGSESVCVEAVEKMTDNYLLRDVAKSTKYESVCLKAIGRMKDEYCISDAKMSLQYKTVRSNSTLKPNVQSTEEQKNK